MGKRVIIKRSREFTAKHASRAFFIKGIPAQFWDSAKAKARAERRSMRNVVLVLVKEWLEKDDGYIYEWLTAAEAAEYARCSVATIHTLAKSGKLKAARVTGSRHYRFRKDWIDSWLNLSARKARPVAVNE